MHESRYGLLAMAQRINVVTSKQASAREQYAAEYLQKKLTEMGYEVTEKRGTRITLSNVGKGPAEGYTICKDLRYLATMQRASSMVVWNWLTAYVKKGRWI